MSLYFPGRDARPWVRQQSRLRWDWGYGDRAGARYALSRWGAGRLARRMARSYGYIGERIDL